VSRDEVLAIPRTHLPEIRALGVSSLALFGSFARDEARPDSDVDVLVEFNADMRVGMNEYFGTKEYLEDLLGRKVDLVMRSGLKPRLVPVVSREEIRVA
jgi:predicted nucleotidyltransferase